MLHRDKRASELSVVVRCGKQGMHNILVGKRQEKINE